MVYLAGLKIRADVHPNVCGYAAADACADRAEDSRLDAAASCGSLYTITS